MTQFVEQNIIVISKNKAYLFYEMRYSMGLISKIKNIFTKKMEVEIDEKNYLGVDINNLYNNVESAYSLCHKLTTSYREKETRS